MKGKMSLLTRKIFALIVAISMSIPPTAFANAPAPVVYDANSSIMGLAPKKEDQAKVENTDQTKIEKDLGDYSLEITSTLDESLTKIDYTIKAKRKKQARNENSDQVSDENLSLTIAKTPTSNINKIKLVSKNTDTETNDPDFKEDFESLVIKSKASDEIIYKLRADVNKAKDQRSYDLIIGLKEADKEAGVFTYNLKAQTGATIVDNQTVELIQLVNNEEKSTKAKGDYKKEGILGGLFTSHDTITWTDYIVNEEDVKEITYDFDIDKNQEIGNTQIGLDYYELTENGFEIKKEFSQKIDFSKKVKFEIPKGFIAKLSLQTKVSKKNTKIKSYSLNKSVLKNPIYIEGNEEEKSSGEEDPLPEEKTPTEKPVEKPAEDKKTSTEIKVDDKKSEENKTSESKKEEKTSDTQITVTDANGNEIPVEEKEKPQKETISAIILNKDSLIARLKAEGKLTNGIETAIESLAQNLDSYNQGKITDQDLKDFTKALATNNNIEKSDLRSYLEAILSGLNKQTNKAANLNYDEIITYAYPEKKEREIKVDAKNSKEKPQAKPEDNKKESKDDSSAEKPAKKPEEKSSEIKVDDKAAEEKEAAKKAFDADLAKLKEQASKNQEEKGVLEGLKSLLGQTDLQKADKELKAALADKSKGLEEIQNLLNSFETKYKLSKADQAKLMDDNGDAIRALIEKDKDSNTKPLTFFKAQNINGLNLEGKKFNIRTIFQTSSAAGPIQPNQFFDIHLDKKLTVNDPSSLKDITYNHRVVAKPKYIKEENKIRYQIQGTIPENLNLPLNIPVDYNQENISLDTDGTFTVTNKVSGLGINNPPKDLLPVKVDKDGNIKGTIIEPGRNDVNQIIEPDDSNYKVNIDAVANPEIEDGQLKGYNWKVLVSSDTNLNTLGFSANLTTVEGSGLGQIEKIKVNGTDQTLIKNPIAGKLGITDSKNYKPKSDIKDITLTFFTQRINKQETYMLDLSLIVKDKISAKRMIVTKGYTPTAVSDATPTRIGMNNRTSIMGEFISNTSSKWTVTDAISTGDDKDDNGKKKINPLPLETRNVTDQTVVTSKYAIYELDTNKSSHTYGQMIEKVAETDLKGNIPAKGTATNDDHSVGTIAAYKYEARLEEPSVNKPHLNYSMGGVEISKEVDLQIEQDWIFDKNVKMPDQVIKAVNSNNHKQELGKVELQQATDNSRTRRFIIPNVRVWEIGNDGQATRLTPRIVQDLPKDQQVRIQQDNGSTITKKYKFIENYNYYKFISGEYYLHNRATEQIDLNYGNFTLVKTDSKDPKTKLRGATFKMFHGPEVVTDENGEAKFSNLEPGSYTLIETKAPDGYRLNDGEITISVDKEGRVTASGKNTSVTGGSTPTATIKHDLYPDYMNAMHYGSIDSNRNIKTYIFLKALGNTRGNSTDRDTRVNINIANINNLQYQVYDISPYARGDIQKQMNLQTIDSTNLNPVLNKEGWQPIIGKSINNGYTIGFPKDRFGGGDDWGFLIEVKGQAQQGKQPSVSYDWVTDKESNQAKLINNQVALSSTTAGQDTVVTVTNEKFPTKPVEVMKVDQKKTPLGGANFIISDSNGVPISTMVSKPDGKVNFGELPVGKYTIEEQEAPDGYQESQIVFDVTVDESKQVFYKARFKNGDGTPVRGKDYWIENEVVKDEDTKANVIEVIQSIKLSENNPGELGERTGVWEAYRYESYTYKAHIKVQSSEPKKRFEIQFDPNLDFTQYVNKIPGIRNNRGVQIADPFFDYDTNLLTYVFNENSGGGQTDFDFVIDGIIPSKYYAPNNGTYNFVIKAAPGNAGAFTSTSNQVLDFSVNAFYDYYDVNDGGSPAQSYYFRDVYQGKDGNWYVKAIAYYNPLASKAKKARTLYFNWFSTNWRGDILIARWPANGNTPAFELNDVKVYRSLPTTDPENPYLINNKKNMPLSMGVRPETDPGTYQLVYSSPIDPKNKKTERQNQITLTYDPSEIRTTGTINQWSPLKLDMPRISDQNEGYVIEQTFKVTDLNKFRTMFRAFFMTNNKTAPRQESAFASKVNTNTAVADQSKKEIPKYYSQKIMMANNRYTPAKFRIRKRDLSNSTKYLSGAVFTLTDKDGKIVARATGKEGILTFENLKPGNYRLEETNAPTGYIKSNKTWNVNVASDGTVTITEIGLNSTGANYVGKDLELEVTNKPTDKDFVVYKRGDDKKPLAGAKFIIKEEKSDEIYAKGESNGDGVVEFDKKLVQGKRYILEESEAPLGYKKLDKKWVLVAENDSVKVYNYIQGPEDNTNPDVNVSLLGEKGTKWVDVVHRKDIPKWTLYDHRWSSYTENSRIPYKLGSRIIAINKDENYVIQRYVINPEGESIGPSRLEIHRQGLDNPNMDWYSGNGEYKIFELDKSVKENVEDIKLQNYKLKKLDTIKAQKFINPENQNDKRMLFNLPATDKPIVIDVKVPYKNESGGVGTGMDYYENFDPTTGSSKVYWKTDYYDDIADIKEGDQVQAEGKGGNILGSYISDNSLDLYNEKKRYDFKFKKVREKQPGQETPDSVSGATFKLTGPKPSEETKWSKSGDDGMVHFNNLIPGTYTLEEHAPAQGYEPADTTWTVTVGKDGKIYFKDNNAGKQAEDPNLQWQSADTTAENPKRHVDSYTSNGSSGKIATKITEVNKKLGKFKQVYILNEKPEKLKNPYFEIHAQEENRDLNLTNTKILSVKLVGSNSKPDRLEFIGEEIKCDIQVYSKTNKKGDTYERIKLIPENLAGEGKTVAVTIESDIPASGSIGTGMDFYNFGSNHYWATEWYDSLKDIKLNPATGAGTSRSSYSVPGESSNQGPSYYTNAPMLMRSVSGLVERNIGMSNEDSPSIPEPITSLNQRSQDLDSLADGLEIGDNLAGTPVAAVNGWEDVDPSRSKEPNNKSAKENHYENIHATTKIIAIDKTNKRMKQRFIFYDDALLKKNQRNIQIHRESEVFDYKLNKSNSTVKVYRVNSGATIDNFNIVQDITNLSNIKDFDRAGNLSDGRKKPTRIIMLIARKYSGPFVVEIETSYDLSKNQEIGLGADYYFNDKVDRYSPKDWVAQTYNKESDINYKTPGPKIEEKEEEVRTTLPIPDQAVRRPNANMKKGEEQEVDPGQEGYRIDLYKVTYIDEVRQPNPEFVRNIKTVDPKPRIIEYGTKDEPQQQTYDVTVYGYIYNGKVTPNKTKAKAGDEVTLTIEPESGYELKTLYYNDEITGDDITIIDNKFIMPASNVRINATFGLKNQLQKYNITSKVDGGHGSVDVSPSQQEEGSDVTITVTPEQGYKIDRVTWNKTDITSKFTNSNSTTYKMGAGNVEVVAKFRQVKEAKEYSLHPENLGKSGTIILKKTKPASNGMAKEGDRIEVSVMPREGYYVERIFTRPETPITSTSANTAYFTMPPKDITVDAIIKPIPSGKYQINIDKPTNGSVSADKAFAGVGDTVKLTAQADPDYEFVRFEVRDANNKQVGTSENTFKMPNTAVRVTAVFKKQAPPPDPSDPGDDVTDKVVEIPNKQAGIELKIFKKDTRGRPLKGGKFKLTKVDSSYQKPDGNFILTAVSDKDGRVVFLDQTGKTVKLQKGYYTIEEVEPPTGYKQASSKWNVEVKDEGGNIYATYFGPEETSVEYLISDKANLGNTTDTNAEIGYASKIKNIDTNAGTFVQRIMIDLRGYKGPEKLNVQVVPKHKKEEYDRAGVSPDIVKEGVKTAYRTTYRINDPAADLKAQDVLNSYDLSKKNVSMVNTARWRPFDWAFDEDQINLEPGGVYFMDIEGYFDPAIITGTATKEKKVVKGVSSDVEPYKRTDILDDDLGKIELDFQLYKGERHFQQAVYNENAWGNIEWKSFPKASYQAGAGAIAKTKPAGWSGQWGKDGKYQNWLGLEGGRIWPELNGKPYWSKMTSANISSLYTANTGKKAKDIPKEGLDLTNEEESYNITFSKHGRDDPNITNNNDDRITENRLEGAVFRLEQKIGPDFVPMPGSYVSSAFNGYFGFRGLKPGRYRLVEVQAPAGYRPINDAILYMTIAYEKEKINQDTGEITPGRGAITLEYASGNGIIQYAPDKTAKQNSGKLVDFVTSGTAKNMGKIINEKPGKGKVTIKKTDEIGQALAGAKFRLVRVSKTGIQDEINKQPQQGGTNIEGVYNGTVDQNGNLTIEQLPIGQYILEELEPAPGHKLTGQKWHFTVGGKDLDPYSGPMNRTGIDQSKNITMTSDMKVVRPNDKDDTANEGDTTIHPNNGHMMRFDNKFTIKPGATISPGDYFVVKMTEKTDLKGIFNKEAISGLDIFADGVGTIAKADYDDVKGTITYTFTEYARTYKLLNFESTYVGHINLAKTRVSTNDVDVGFWMNDNDSTKKTINVSYELGTKDVTDWNGNNINLSSKITYFEPETGRFEHIIYINRDGKNSNGAQFVYKPGKNISNLRFEMFKVNNNYDKSTTMPPSYSVDYSNGYMTRVINNYYNRTVNDYNPVYQSFNNSKHSTDPSLDRNDSYVVRITGNISDGEDKTAYTPEARLRRFNSYGYVYMWAKREDEVYSRLNTNEAKADLTISAINPRNKIIFRKTDQNYKTLEGAVFGLEKYKGIDAQTQKEEWEEVKGDGGKALTAKTGADGLASFEKLPEGRYALVEKIAPKGYTRIETHILEFEVSKNGIITRKVKKNGGIEDQVVTEVVGTSPIEVINYKDVEFIKIDADNGKHLPGAKFELWYKEKLKENYRKLKDDEYSKQIYSDSEGKFKIHVTRNGYYALKETKVPSGYEEPDTEFVKEFKLENGKIQVLEKDPLKASYKIASKGFMESRILSVDHDKRQFTQRIILNPKGVETSIDGPGTYLRFHGNGWKIIPPMTVGGKIKVALLEKGMKVDDLNPSDYVEIDATSRITEPEIISRYQIKDMLDKLGKKLNKNLYTGPEPDKNVITTDATLVVEYTGQLTGTGDKEKIAEIKQDLYFDLTYLDQMIYDINLDQLKEGKPTYVDKSDLRPVEVENKKLHKVKFKKVDARTRKALDGAEFKLLYRADTKANWQELKLYEKDETVDDEKVKKQLWATSAPKETGYIENTNNFVTSGKDGLVEFDNLSEPGLYAIKETKAPAGFALPLTKDNIVKTFEIKDGKLYLTEKDKDYVQKDDGFYYSTKDDSHTGNYLSIKKEYRANKLVYTWTINSSNAEITYYEGAKLVLGGDIPANAELKAKVFKDKKVVDINTSNYTASLTNGVLDLKTYLEEGKVVEKPEAGKTEDTNSEKPKPAKPKLDKSTSKIVITYETTPNVTDEKPKIDYSIKSNLSGIKDNFVAIDDKFTYEKKDNSYDSITSTEIKVEERYVDENLANTDKEGTLEVENRKVELPKALGTGNILTYTLAGLAVMLAGVFIYYKKKQVIEA